MNIKYTITTLASFLYGLFLVMPTPGIATETTPLQPQPLSQTIAREKPKLLLYYLPWCPYSQRVLEYLKQIHRAVPCKNLQQDPKGREELRRLGGKIQVPCLMIDGKAMYESATIIQWLSQNRTVLDPN